MSEAYTNEVAVAHKSLAWWFNEVPVMPGSTLVSPVFDLSRGYPPDASLVPGSQTAVVPGLPAGDIWELNFFASGVGLANPVMTVATSIDGVTFKLIEFIGTGIIGNVLGNQLSGILIAQFCRFGIGNFDLVITSDFTGVFRVRPA